MFGSQQYPKDSAQSVRFRTLQGEPPLAPSRFSDNSQGMAGLLSRVVQTPDVFPLLASTYARGHLVPFLGAGMSAPMLNLWKPFVERLEGYAKGMGMAIAPGVSQETLEARAERAYARIRNSAGHSEGLRYIREALRAGSSEVPTQTQVLATIRWPLAISTNYDDLFYGAVCLASGPNSPPILVGRSPQHCKRVISSLTGPLNGSYIWHVQGFLGGQHPELAPSLLDPLAPLNRELVIGHSEYRAVTSSAPHFRRCFGEVFRSRSFLFLGSGLSEAYFENLFGEVLQFFGPGPVPHFAVALKDTLDRHFLADQMNIVVCELNDWAELPYWLGQLKRAVEEPKARTAQWSFAVRTNGGTDSRLDISGAEPPASFGAGEALAIVAHRTQDNRPEIPSSEERFVPAEIFSGARFDGASHVAQSQRSNCFAVSARIAGSKDSAVDDAVRELLLQTWQHGFRTVHLRLPADGNVPAVYGFMETVRTFGRWQEENPYAATNLKLYVHPEVVDNLTANRIDIHELLTSDLIQFWISVDADRDEEPERRVFYCPPETPFQAVLDELDVQPSKEWLVSIHPTPRWPGDTPPDMATAALAELTLLKIGVAFGSVLSITRATAQAAAGGV